MIFVDNSGADIILGVLPFARELLRRGSQVCTLTYFSFNRVFLSGSLKPIAKTKLYVLFLKFRNFELL